MSKRDDAYMRVKAVLDCPTRASFDPVVAGVIDHNDLRLLLEVFEDWETEHEILHDLVTDESEKRAIGGGPNWRERHEKTWRRAMELFEP